MRRPVAFLFLGETLLIPHLYPIVEALAGLSSVPIDLWVSTSVHEELLARWTKELGNPAIRIRRAPGFRLVQGGVEGRNPSLPAKLPMLVRLLPHLIRAPVAVCAEQTSLWLPTLLPMPTRFVNTLHGAGSMNARDDRRRRSPRLTLVPSERERQAFLDRGIDPDRIVATGYVKASFRHRTRWQPSFREKRPIILYTPHWQPHRSSWPRWGKQIVIRLAEQQSYNVIIAPHQRLIEHAPELREIMASVAKLDHVHCDLDSFSMVDGSYTYASDIYLGDTSSQVVEFLMQPRPCVFLNSYGVPWQGDYSYAQWECGEVVDKLEDVLAALGRALYLHPKYLSKQRQFASSSLGDTGPDAPVRAAKHILALLEKNS